jgi:hypothetical protein
LADGPVVALHRLLNELLGNQIQLAPVALLSVELPAHASFKAWQV